MGDLNIPVGVIRHMVTHLPGKPAMANSQTQTADKAACSGREAGQAAEV
jgi:hypothetical protein